MKFTIKIWKLAISFDLFDLDPSDQQIGISIYISWKAQDV